jgi:ParB/RepB/Spo0J family partition protein
MLYSVVSHYTIYLTQGPRLMPDLNPQSIVINRDTRQRQDNITDIEDLKLSISTIGIINPIVVRQQDGQVILVAGERRLQASLSLGLADVPVRFFEDLSPEDAEVIELEENIKRKELSWKDQVRALGRLHQIYKTKDPKWKVEQTAEAVSLHRTYMHKILHVHAALTTGRVQQAQSIDQAYNTLQRFGERKAESIVGDIITKGATIFNNAPLNAPAKVNADAPATSASFTTVSAVSVAPTSTNIAATDSVRAREETQVESQLQGLVTAYNAPTDPVLCANFIEWITTYNGPKFTLLHCDFPYGNYRGGDSQGSLSATDVDEFYDNDASIYWKLLDTLTSHLDKVMSYSAHMLFWFSMNFYSETVARLRKTGLIVHDHPIVHHKTGGPGGLGVVPGTAVTYPRRTYDTALLCVRGNRPLAKPGMNSYAAPTAGNKIHPSQKPEPMLRFFLSMLVDETTTMLDPTCGSGAALRAAEDLGAKYVLGIEMDKSYAETANTKTLQARVLRQAGTSLRREDVA